MENTEWSLLRLAQIKLAACLLVYKQFESGMTSRHCEHTFIPTNLGHKYRETKNFKGEKFADQLRLNNR